MHSASDGSLIVHHDPVVGTKQIASMSLSDIRRSSLPNGERIPTLPESLDAIGPKLKVFIELKSLDPTLDEVLFSCLESGPKPQNYHIHSFDHRIVMRLHNKRAGLTYGVLSTSYPVRPLVQLHDAGASELWQEKTVIDAALIEEVHAEGYHIYAWTVDDRRRMKELLDLGVNAICTNKPDIGRQVIG